MASVELSVDDAIVARYRAALVRSARLETFPAIRHGITGRVPGIEPADGNIGYSAPRDRDAAWRERRAQESDQPRSRILKDDALIELAMQRPLTPEAFDKLRAVQRGFGRSSAAAEIVSLLKQVEALDKKELPKLPDRYRGPSPKGAVGDLVRVLLKAVSEQHGVASRIIATSDDIDADPLLAEIGDSRKGRF